MVMERVMLSVDDVVLQRYLKLLGGALPTMCGSVLTSTAAAACGHAALHYSASQSR